MAESDIAAFQLTVAILGLPLLAICFPLCLIPCTTPLYLLLAGTVTGLLGLSQYAKSTL
jgi:hypothetical protein